VNNSGYAAFGALKKPTGATTQLGFGLGGSTPSIIDLPTPSLPRPMVSDQQTIVSRYGNQLNSPIYLFRDTLDLRTAIVIADSQYFNETGNQPGITDDGRVVTFYGNLNGNGVAYYQSRNSGPYSLNGTDAGGLTSGAGIF